ncbi:MAG TPA: lectin ESA-2 [Tenacibaculum sp.]|nr:lectin ESA-2 [Tenacibaculum sp.]HBI39611.1 lectin ESA-2 [Tenacibaculum sp.]
MSIYQVQNKWGDSPFQNGGIYVLGSRSNQLIVDVNIKSEDGGKTLAGTITYQGEGPIGFKGVQVVGNNYKVKNEWGDTWNDGGNWVIGGRDGQNVVALKASATSEGLDLIGEVTYEGEESILFEGEKISGSAYEIKNQHEEISESQSPEGVFVLGARDRQHPVSLDMDSEDNGKTLLGTMTYENEGVIGVKAIHVMGNVYSVQNQWNGEVSPWHPGGCFIIGGRVAQRVIEIQITSKDEGQNFSGEITYSNEEPILIEASVIGKLATV